LRVRDSRAAIDFCQRAFGATELFRLVEPTTGRIGHAEIKIGKTVIMLSDEFPEYGIVGPKSIAGTSFTMHLHVDDADAWIERAVAEGATLVRAPSDAFYGERSGPCVIRKATNGSSVTRSRRYRSKRCSGATTP